MKTKILFLLFIYSIQTISAQHILGIWQGELTIQGMELPIVFHISEKEGKLKATMDSPKQGAKGIPVEKCSFQHPDFSLEMPAIGLSYSAKLENNKLVGTFQQSGLQLPLVLVKKDKEYTFNRPQTPKPPFNYKVDEVRFINPLEKNTLAGSLSIPKNNHLKKPILILINGSGQQNRDSELFGHQPFAVLADYLAMHGISTLRLDDRGVGESTIGTKDETSFHYATDILSAVDFLVEKGYKNIGLLGHSEGGMIAPMVANRHKKVKWLILMAAPGIPIDQLMIQQNELSGQLLGLDSKTIVEYSKTNKMVYDFIKDYQGEEYENDFKFHFKNILEKDIMKKTIAETENAWFQYFIKYNPQTELEKLKIPVLAMNGRKDFQVSAKENLEAIEKHLQKAKNKKFKILTLEGQNHLFQECETGSFSEYSTIEQTISPKTLEIIKNWINENN